MYPTLELNFKEDRTLYYCLVLATFIGNTLVGTYFNFSSRER